MWKNPKSASYLYLALSSRLKKCGASKGQKARISRFITRSGPAALVTLLTRSKIRYYGVETSDSLKNID